MAFRLYIVPQVFGSMEGQTARVPKYFFPNFRWAGMDYGFQPIYLVAADLAPADDAAIIANSDVVAFPFDLATTVGGGQALTNARNALEAALIPAQWVAASSTWSEVARTVAGMFQFMQRLNFVLGNTVVIDTSAKLNVQWSSIPTDTQNAIISAAQSLGYTFNPQPNDQLRTLLKNLADQWGSRAFQLNEFSF